MLPFSAYAVERVCAPASEAANNEEQGAEDARNHLFLDRATDLPQVFSEFEILLKLRRKN